MAGDDNIVGTAQLRVLANFQDFVQDANDQLEALKGGVNDLEITVLADLSEFLGQVEGAVEEASGHEVRILLRVDGVEEADAEVDEVAHEREAPIKPVVEGADEASADLDETAEKPRESVIETRVDTAVADAEIADMESRPVVVHGDVELSTAEAEARLALLQAHIREIYSQARPDGGYLALADVREALPPEFSRGEVDSAIQGLYSNDRGFDAVEDENRKVLTDRARSAGVPIGAHDAHAIAWEGSYDGPSVSDAQARFDAVRAAQAAQSAAPAVEPVEAPEPSVAPVVDEAAKADSDARAVEAQQPHVAPITPEVVGGDKVEAELDRIARDRQSKITVSEEEGAPRKGRRSRRTEPSDDIQDLDAEVEDVADEAERAEQSVTGLDAAFAKINSILRGAGLDEVRPQENPADAIKQILDPINAERIAQKQLPIKPRRDFTDDEKSLNALREQAAGLSPDELRSRLAGTQGAYGQLSEGSSLVADTKAAQKRLQDEANIYSEALGEGPVKFARPSARSGSGGQADLEAIGRQRAAADVDAAREGLEKGFQDADEGTGTVSKLVEDSGKRLKSQLADENVMRQAAGLDPLKVQTVKVVPEVVPTEAEAQMAALKAEWARFTPAEVEVETAKALEEINAVRAEVSAEPMRSELNVDARVDEALAKINALRAEAGADPIRLKVDDDDAQDELSALESAADSASAAVGAIGDAAQFGALTAGIAGVVSELAGLVGMAGAAAGALAGIGGTFAVGFTGVGSVFSALHEATLDKRGIAEDGSGGGGGGESAQERADRISDAEHSVETAQNNLKSATDDVTTAYQTQQTAIQDASEAMQDWANKAVDSKLGLEGKAIDLAEDKQNYAKVLYEYQHGQASGLDLQRAALQVETGQQGLVEYQEKDQQTQQENQTVQREGITGNPKVEKADKGIADALTKESDAEYNLQKAIRTLNEAKTDTGSSSGGGSGDRYQNELNAELKRLAPNARDLVDELLPGTPLREQWHGAQQETQNTMFAGSAGELQSLSDDLLPSTEFGLTTLAGTINGTVLTALQSLDKQFTANAQNGTFLKYLTSVGDTASGLPNLLSGVTNAVTNLTIADGPGLGKMLSALGTGISGSSGVFGDLGAQLESQLTHAFEGMPGFFEQMEKPAEAATGVIGKLFSGVGHVLEDNSGALTSFFQSVQGLEPVLEDLAPYLTGTLGYISDIFKIMGAFPEQTALALSLIYLGKQISPILNPLGTLFTSLSTEGETALQKANSAFSNFASGLGTVRTQVEESTAGIRTAFSELGSALSPGLAQGAVNDAVGGGFSDGIASEFGGITAAEQGVEREAPTVVGALKNVGTEMSGLASGAMEAVSSGFSGLATMLGPAGIFGIAVVGVTVAIGELVAAHGHEVQAQQEAKQATDERTQSLRKLKDALDATSGVDTPEVAQTADGLVTSIRAEADSDKDQHPDGAMTAGRYFLKYGNFGLNSYANQQVDRDRTENREGADGAAEVAGLDELGKKYSDDEITSMLTGSEADFKSLIAQTNTLSSGGALLAQHFQDARTQWLGLQSAAETVTPGVQDMATAMGTLADNTASAADKQTALTNALKVAAGQKSGQTDPSAAQSALGQAERNLGQGVQAGQGSGAQLVNANGSLNATTANGAALLGQFQQMQTALSGMAQAGALTDAQYDHDVALMTQQLTNLGVSADQAKTIIDKVGFNRQVLFQLHVAGEDSTEANLQAVAGDLFGNENSDGTYGVTLPVKIADAGVQDELKNLQGVVEDTTSKPGYVVIHADTEAAVEAIDGVASRDQELDQLKAEPHADLNIDDFTSKYMQADNDLDAINGKVTDPAIQADITDFLTKGKLTSDQLTALNAYIAQPGVDPQTATALSELSNVATTLNQLNGKTANVGVTMDALSIAYRGTDGQMHLWTAPNTEGAAIAGNTVGAAQAPQAVPTPGLNLSPAQQKLLSSGALPALAGGGPVAGAGTSTSDSIPAWLSDGEFVHKAAAVDYYGPEAMHAINSMAVPKDALKRASGGPVTAGQSGTGVSISPPRTSFRRWMVEPSTCRYGRPSRRRSHPRPYWPPTRQVGRPSTPTTTTADITRYAWRSTSQAPWTRSPNGCSPTTRTTRRNLSTPETIRS
ncbi:hypothetical protein [Tsukamurella soli]|uniref:hypothetical protein n=1 Tax=Tsukamurella soli TaxID=644556 RepID=UPI00361E16F3